MDFFPNQKIKCRKNQTEGCKNREGVVPTCVVKLMGIAGKRKWSVFFCKVGHTQPSRLTNIHFCAFIWRVYGNGLSICASGLNKIELAQNPLVKNHVSTSHKQYDGAWQ